MSDVVFASYNVHGCRGTDGIVDVDRVGEVIRALDADVVGLQEIDCRIRDAKQSDQLDRLAAITGLQAVPGPTIREGDGYYGNALLTRHSVIDVTEISLSYRGREPRGMMDVIVDLGIASIRVIVTHFGLQARERRHQVDSVLSILERQRGQSGAPSPSDPVVLLGDFNEWRARSVTLSRLHEAFGRAPAVRTFPSYFPLFALDRIWVRPRRTLRGATAERTPLSKIASDHLPLRATLTLSGFQGTQSAHGSNLTEL